DVVAADEPAGGDAENVSDWVLCHGVLLLEPESGGSGDKRVFIGSAGVEFVCDPHGSSQRCMHVWVRPVHGRCRYRWGAFPRVWVGVVGDHDVWVVFVFVEVTGSEDRFAIVQ